MAINREKVLEAAQKFVEKKKYDKAIVEYQKIIQEDPNDARILLKVGDIQSKMEAYGEAVATYEKVGKFYAQQGFALKAIAVYKQIREMIAKHVPQLEEKYQHIAPKLADLYQQLGLTSDALAALDEVATRLQRAGKDAEAVGQFRKIVELDPTNPLPHLRLAEALSRGQDMEGAVVEFAVAAGLLVNLGRRDDALKVYERLLHHKPDPERARQAAELYLARNQPNDGMAALSKLQICFQADPKNLDTLSLLARAFLAIGQASKAIEVQKEMARIALEQGNQELFSAIVDRLRKQVPQDETIIRMAQAAGIGGPPPQHVSPQPPPVQMQAPPTAQMQVPARPPPPPPPPPAPRAPARPAPMAAPMPPPPVQHEGSYASVPPEELEEIEEDFDGRDGRDSDAGFGRPIPARPGQDAAPPPAYPASVPAALAPPPAPGLGPAVPVVPSVPSVPQSAARIAQVLADAASFRRVRLYKKAIETLRTGIGLDPRNVELYETLRQILFEARQEDQSIEVGLTLAGLYVDGLDGESAARVLQDVLALDARNPRALEMLHELGYELADEGTDGEAFEQPQEAPGQTTDLVDVPPGFEQADVYSDPQHGALPSYDLEEMGPSDVSHRYEDESRRRLPSRPVPGAGSGANARGNFEADDPFASQTDEASGSLPGYPLDATGEQTSAHRMPADDVHSYGTDRPLDNAEYQAYEQEANETYPRAQTARPAQSASPPHAELEDALEEAEFFASRGLYADARTILNDQLERYPNHPLILDRMSELEELEQQARDGGGDTDGHYGIGTLDDIEAPSQAVGGFSAATQQVDVEEVFAKFKEGVARQISIDDAQSHYDLGVAYKEMGLTEDAIREFETAARDEKRECVCLSMVGMIEMERGNVDQALDAFLRGVNARLKQNDQETVLNFEIAACYEAKRMNKEALGYYKRVQAKDPKYRDVEARVRRLSGGEEKSAVRQSTTDEEMFDQAFEDLLDDDLAGRK